MSLDDGTTLDQNRTAENEDSVGESIAEVEQLNEAQTPNENFAHGEIESFDCLNCHLASRGEDFGVLGIYVLSADENRKRKIDFK